MIRIEMEDGGVIELELYPDIAPLTAANFEKLAKEGFYDGLIFHRVISGFMIQGGDPTGTGMDGSKEKIKGEFEAKGCPNALSRSQNYDSASSQFFIMHQNGEFLDGQYAAFGKVVKGMEVVDRIAAVPTDYSDRPRAEQKMKKVTVI